MVKQNPKERLNNKAAKMIDLLFDEVFFGGEKSIGASFKDFKDNDKTYHLAITLGVEFEDENKEEMP